MLHALNTEPLYPVISTHSLTLLRSAIERRLHLTEPSLIHSTLRARSGAIHQDQPSLPIQHWHLRHLVDFLRDLAIHSGRIPSRERSTRHVRLEICDVLSTFGRRVRTHQLHVPPTAHPDQHTTGPGTEEDGQGIHGHHPQATTARETRGRFIS